MTQSKPIGNYWKIKLNTLSIIITDGAIVFLSTLSSILFLGGYLIPGVESNGLMTGLSLGFKTSILLFILIWIRASFPRLRYDQLMAAIWCNMLPVVIAFSILIPCIIKAFEIY